jgi:hypothetical protein
VTSAARTRASSVPVTSHLRALADAAGWAIGVSARLLFEPLLSLTDAGGQPVDCGLEEQGDEATDDHREEQ